MSDTILKTIEYKGRKIHKVRVATRTWVLGGRYMKEGYRTYWKLGGALYDLLRDVKQEIDKKENK
jgi:hypothetical protein